jgi:aspartyl/asparaginyl beta-hydroxylase (cupin superfamily)
MKMFTDRTERRASSTQAFLLRPKFLLKRIVFPLAVFVPLGYFLPKLTLFYALCGIYDVSRNPGLNGDVLRRYFLGNGTLLWLLSPFNILMDLLTLPHINKGVYRLKDLPAAYQEEVKLLIEVAQKENLVAQLEERSKEFPRTMIFFKWYGVNVDTFLNIAAFHQPWKYIQTIGVSVFNKKVSTSQHFGFLRATLRILYNLNDIDDRSAYITVGDKTNYWCENKLFIFDDTLMHQSFNETDKTRYCLFVDMIRPTLLPGLLVFAVSLIRALSRSVNFIFYQNWKVIER